MGSRSAKNRAGTELAATGLSCRPGERLALLVTYPKPRSYSHACDVRRERRSGYRSLCSSKSHCLNDREKKANLARDWPFL
ncbi:hypothetical protein, partial [Methylophaga pinxianii]